MTDADYDADQLTCMTIPRETPTLLLLLAAMQKMKVWREQISQNMPGYLMFLWLESSFVDCQRHVASS